MSSAPPRVRVVEEIVQTERNYVQNLEILRDVFLTPLRTPGSGKPILSHEQISSVFSSLDSIIACSRELCSQLDARWSNWQESSTLGDVFLGVVEFLKMYIPYVENFNQALTFTTDAIASKSEFGKFLTKGQTSKACKGLTFQGYLIMPVQRILRYNLLLKELLKATPSTHTDFASLSTASERVTALASQVNERKRDAEALESVVEIQLRLKDAPEYLVTPSRRLVLRSTGFEVTDGIAGPPCHVLLFNDLLLLCRDGKKSVFGRSGKHPGGKLEWVRDVPLANVDEVTPGTAVSNAVATFVIAQGRHAHHIALTDITVESAREWQVVLLERVAVCKEEARKLEEERVRVSQARAQVAQSLITHEYTARRLGAGRNPISSAARGDGDVHRRSLSLHEQTLQTDASDGAGGVGGASQQRRWSRGSRGSWSSRDDGKRSSDGRNSCSSGVSGDSVSRTYAGLTPGQRHDAKDIAEQDLAHLRAIEARQEAERLERASAQAGRAMSAIAAHYTQLGRATGVTPLPVDQ